MIFIATDKITAYDNWFATKDEVLKRKLTSSMKSKILTSIMKDVPYVDLRRALMLNSSENIHTDFSQVQENKSETMVFITDDKVISTGNWFIQDTTLTVYGTDDDKIDIPLRANDFSEIADFVKEELDAHRSYIDFRNL